MFHFIDFQRYVLSGVFEKAKKVRSLCVSCSYFILWLWMSPRRMEVEIGEQKARYVSSFFLNINKCEIQEQVFDWCNVVIGGQTWYSVQKSTLLAKMPTLGDVLMFMCVYISAVKIIFRVHYLIIFHRNIILYRINKIKISIK